MNCTMKNTKNPKMNQRLSPYLMRRWYASNILSIPRHSKFLRSTLPYTIAVRYLPQFHHTTKSPVDGSPLGLADIVNTSLFRPSVFDTAERTTFALSIPDQSFPLLSQGDHPTLGTPSWYFHPCESAHAVDELMTELGEAEWTTEERIIRWIELWFMVVGTAVDLSQ